MFVVLIGDVLSDVEIHLFEKRTAAMALVIERGAGRLADVPVHRQSAADSLGWPTGSLYRSAGCGPE